MSDIVPAGFSGRAVPVGMALAPTNELYAGTEGIGTGKDRVSGLSGFTPRPSFLDEPTVQEATRELSKHCIVDGCRAFHKNNSQFCVGHSRSAYNTEPPR